jgi:hypothetical protein
MDRGEIYGDFSFLFLLLQGVTFAALLGEETLFRQAKKPVDVLIVYVLCTLLIF